MFWKRKAKGRPVDRPDAGGQFIGAPGPAAADPPAEGPAAADARWRVVSRAELASYPACPSCRWKSPPDLARCPRCHALLPRAVAGATAGPIPRIGAYLLRRGIVGPREIQLALSRQRELAEKGMRRRFGEVLIEMRLASRAQVEEAAAEQAGEFGTIFVADGH